MEDLRKEINMKKSKDRILDEAITRDLENVSNSKDIKERYAMMQVIGKEVDLQNQNKKLKQENERIKLDSQRLDLERQKLEYQKAKDLKDQEAKIKEDKKAYVRTVVGYVVNGVTTVLGIVAPIAALCFMFNRETKLQDSGGMLSSRGKLIESQITKKF